MRILVTGGTGFIGSNLAKELLLQRHEVFVTGLDEEREPSYPPAKNLGYDFASLDWERIGKVDALFHEAAINETTLLDRDQMLKVNLYDSQKLFRDAAHAGCTRIVYASSTAVYGNGPVPYREGQELQPLNPYAESKAALDRWAMEFAKEQEVKIVGLRYCNVYGPGERRKGERATMIYQLARQMKAGRPRIFKWGEQKRDYIYVKDVVRANILALRAKESCIVNCGFGQATSFNDIIKILNAELGLEREPEYIDNPYAARYQNFTQCDMSLAKKKLGFVPEFDIGRGIKDYYESGFLVS